MKNSMPSLESFMPQLLMIVDRLKRHAVLLFVLLLGVIYGFVLNKINAFSNVQPGTSQISAQVKTLSTPQIDPAIVNQLQNLKDNSVNVQALFDQARKNPFQE
jgi:hypothetical protein